MQTRFLQVTNTLNEYRTVIIALIVFAVILAFMVSPSMVVEAGRAAANGG